ncbi:FadR/GntR family transcriptional regulator [Stappia indica]|uniref:FCD domain-containing protein n=1 Tax=Stappia indica TaxID=538381 RepID=A0A857CCX2_9HYPH|nr:FadR/GntR family transcriptional regulator [Stappia indica]QGZ36691.1 FCD domain-containing protein [Stappia indica]
MQKDQTSLPAASQPMRGNLKSAVAETLALRILDGTYQPGTTLPTEAELLGSLGVSRTCLREALQILVGKGLITSRPKHGTSVRPEVNWNFLDDQMLTWRQKVVPQGQLLAELVAIREMVEPEAAALAAQNADAQTIAALREALDAMGIADGNRTPATQDADVRFHRLLLAAGGNALLSGLGACIENALRASIRISSDPGVSDPIALGQHAKVLDAVEAREPERAREEMRKLMAMTRALLTRVKALD